MQRNWLLTTKYKPYICNLMNGKLVVLVKSSFYFIFLIVLCFLNVLVFGLLHYFRPYWCKPSVVKNFTVWSSNVNSLKYKRFTIPGCKDIGIQICVELSWVEVSFCSHFAIKPLILLTYNCKGVEMYEKEWKKKSYGNVYSLKNNHYF